MCRFAGNIYDASELISWIRTKLYLLNRRVNWNIKDIMFCLDTVKRKIQKKEGFC